MQEHLLTFEQQWPDEASGRSLPKFVTDELHGFMSCGILGRGFAHLYCDTCHEHYAVAFSCKARAVCPTCLGRRMSEGAFHLTEYVLPDVPLRQFVVTMPFCSKCHSQLRLIALVKTESVAQKILKAMHLPTEIPELHPARPPRPPPENKARGDDWLN
jgi:hypothetical protein